ncbi:MAG: FAD-dependent oxidoreductase [Endozoicomonas sp. (ex Botrylloides leachii)]|nr:FAD-dependent oxidoreductase [Endozoicomonas sp. (ex Botrylloides leachii)]
MSDKRIIIIGAGPAGISAAKFLSEQGAHNVTLLEAGDRPGGKCTSVNYGGLWHELATSYSAWGYNTLHRWFNQHAIAVYKVKPLRMLVKSGNKLATVTLKEYALGGLTIQHKRRAISQLFKFQRLWLRFFFHELRGSKNTDINQKLAMPFGEWLDFYQLDIVKRFAGRAIVSAGYGYLETVPALHCLRWLRPSIIIAGLFGQVWEPVPGFENALRAFSWDQDIRYNKPVKQVLHENGCVRVVCEDGEELICDDVIVACPLSQAKSFFPETSVQYKLGSAMNSHQYATIFFKIKGRLLDGDNETIGLPDNFPLSQAGKPLVIRRTGNKIPAKAVNADGNEEYYVSYHYKSDLTEEKLTEYLNEAIIELGGQLETVLEIRQFNYMQTYDKQAITSGLVQKLNQQQGEQHIWFSTASMSFESVDNIMDQNEELVHSLLDGNKPHHSESKNRIYWIKLSRLFKPITFIRYWRKTQINI